MKYFKYAILTPCFNEEKYIESVIESVKKQTVKPEKWLIIDDGSTDNTWDVIQKHYDDTDWIEYLYIQKKPGVTYYSSNVYAIIAGYNKLQEWEKTQQLNFDFLAILDADIILCSDYYESISHKFDQNKELGIATGTYLEDLGDGWIEAQIDRRSTPKALQVFKRECYDKCGGYIPFKYGGEDSGMEIMARMYGWQTWSFNEIQVKHLRPVGTGNGQVLLKARFNSGFTEHALATHSIFMFLKCLKRIYSEKPYVISGILRFFGFIYAKIMRKEQQLPYKAMKHVRSEQKNRMLNYFKLGNAMWLPNE